VVLSFVRNPSAPDLIACRAGCPSGYMLQTRTGSSDLIFFIYCKTLKPFPLEMEMSKRTISHSVVFNFSNISSSFSA